jgi:sigma-B regulation protein RsbU (phosphoserine phosphatase)
MREIAMSDTAPLDSSRSRGEADARAALILVVDDSEANRDSLRRRLARHGYEVEDAADGPTALELIGRRPFDLVLLDVMMPGMSGLEVLEEVRRRRSPTDLPIIMATAQGESDSIVAALDRGASDYVTKPLDFPIVLARVRTQLLLKRSVDRAAELERNLNVRNADLQAANAKLGDHARRAAFDLDAAARVQRTFLPSPSPKVAGATFAWALEPCQQLAGDSLNILQLDPDHVAFYVLDVSGHGVAASLLAVAATRLLSGLGAGDSIVRTSSGGTVIPAQPADVAATLNARFESNPETGQYMTLFYGLLNSRTRVLTYVSAGHPEPVLIPSAGEPRLLVGSGSPIGFGNAYDQQTVQLAAGDRVFLYSDGVIEDLDPAQVSFGIDRLKTFLSQSASGNVADTIASLLETLGEWRHGKAAEDDISVLALEC